MTISIGTAGSDSLFGSGSDDELYGLDGDDELEGLDGNDLLDGGGGADQMAGGAGDDVYIVDDAGDVVVEDEDAGVDEVRTAWSNYALAANVEKLTGLSTDSQMLNGNNLDNVITGGAGQDMIHGWEGDDTIIHSSGGDGVVGGTGYDVYVLPGSSGDYQITRGGPVIIHDLVGDEPDVFLYEMEELRFEGDDSSVTIAALFDRFGTEGADTLLGDDSDNNLYGNGGDDILVAYGGNDYLDGGAGADTMTGGAGDDLYKVDDAGDAIVELAGGGYDIVWNWAASFTMGANVEALTSLHEGDVTIVGNASANEIVTGSGDDWIEGLGGNDYLDGGTGVDTMIGGGGDDVYWVRDVGDVVTEAAGGGIDHVYEELASYTLPANVENVTLGYVDQTLTGNALANLIIMGPGAKIVNGGAGSDTVDYEAEGEAVVVDLLTGVNGGGAADDVLTSIENVTGSWFDDELRGTNGANILDGGYGTDTLIGRGGNDIYYVSHMDDIVVEEAGGGTDEIRSFFSEYYLPDNVEKLKYVGTDYFYGFGNDLNNDITGGPGDDELHGGDGHDNLMGGLGDDRLFGDAGHDTLSGGAGADHMEGGDGNDVYIVDDSGDEVVELAGEGLDQVYASIDAFTLPDDVENLTFTGHAAVHGVGNGLANVIYGNDGADTLEGEGGADELRSGYGDDILLGGDGDDLLVGGWGVDAMTGGAGADLFRFSLFDSGTGAAADRIADFTSGEDRIDLSGVDANYSVSGDQAFTFIGGAAFSSAAGELRYAFDGTDTWLQADIDGNGMADFEIVLAGAVTPLAADFIL